MAHQRPHRNARDMEVGVAVVTTDHPNQFHNPPPATTPPAWLTKWEARRPRWLMECFAEALGVFFYVYCGMGASAAFFVTTAAKETGFGSLFTIGWAYGLGIAFGILVSGPTSGSHLSPGYTIAFAIFKGFPWRKVPQYIIAQILGAFIGSLAVYGIYRQQLVTITAELEILAPTQIFSSQGPAGIFALLTLPGQGLGYVFLNEIFASTLLALVVFTVLDLSNPFISFVSAPILIGMGYAVVIWAFAPVSLVLNTARDLGGRFVAAIFFGREAFPGRYTALAVFTNLLGTVLGATIQILFLADSTRPMSIQVPAGEVHRVVTRQEPLTAHSPMGAGEKALFHNEENHST
ncbi:hypothetical protein FRB94_001380 [Tulasnella sp. JGI-2019a]|nr:hypothetical protein FRB93_013534 [Tulasnella sp. JGI-2019a]KAG9005596.1 hypothetical protein FRB94_001380 [Tulasnella sp. JGI-2019a]KAG9034488.1 hypothetical protein FRB95_013164 [Tulasnella sp. JGI-2019a]